MLNKLLLMGMVGSCQQAIMFMWKYFYIITKVQHINLLTHKKGHKLKQWLFAF